MDLVQKSFMRLWPDAPPGALVRDAAATLPNEDTPTLQVFRPVGDTATGAAIIICPGGGYRRLADHEGSSIAEWLADHGVTAFVLRYRLAPRYLYPVQFADARRALRFVRSHADTWGLWPERIGILGFSAGGHLASMAATRFSTGDSTSNDPVENFSSRPALQILIYPVISFHLSYRPVSVVLGDEPQPTSALLDELSSDQHVQSTTPPAFLVHSTDDTAVVVENSDRYAASLAAAGVPYEYVRGSLGKHGFGLQESWSNQCLDWLAHYDYARKS